MNPQQNMIYVGVDLHDVIKNLAVHQLPVSWNNKTPRNTYFLNYYQQKLEAGRRSNKQSSA